jgi:hypothetical protein
MGNLEILVDPSVLESVLMDILPEPRQKKYIEKRPRVALR